MELCRDLGVPKRLRDVGADPVRFDEIEALWLAAGYNRWNPRTTSRDEFKELLLQAY